MASSKSIIWTIFKKCHGDNLGKAECTLCEKTEPSRFLIRGKTARDWSTTLLWNHVKAKHPLKYKEIKTTDEVTSKNTELSEHVPSQSVHGTEKAFEKQLTSSESFTRTLAWGINDEKSKKFSKLIGEMIALDAEPYSMVEREGFVRFIKEVLPKYEIPHRTYFSRTVIPEIYGRITKKVSEKLKEALFISFTTDLWTCSSNNEAFISLSAHFLHPKSLKQQIFCLAVQGFDQQHTAINIAHILNEILGKWKIAPRQLHVIMRDNAANIVLGTGLTELEGTSCFIHTLQLAIGDGILKQLSVSSILASCRKIVGHFKSSTSACNKLKIIQESNNLPLHQLTQDVPTRWNSTYEMLQRIHEQKLAVTVYSTDHDIPQLAAFQWNIIENVIRLLQPFHETTKQASSDGETISFVIPAVKTLLSYLSKRKKDAGVQAMKEQLKIAVDKRFNHIMNIQNKTCFVIATVLDPRFKMFFIEHVKQAKNWIVSEMVDNCSSLNMERDTNANIGDNNATTSATSELGMDIHEDFWDCFNEFTNLKPLQSLEAASESLDVAVASSASEGQECQSPTKQLIVNKCKLELDMFLNLPLLPRSKSCLQWWELNHSQYPHLTPLVLKYLSAPPSSVFSERLFSAAGRVYADNRNRLSPEHAEQLIFLLKNMKHFDFSY